MALATSVIVMVAGVAVDGGYALVQRRSAQNSADFAALAAARVVAVWIADNNEEAPTRTSRGDQRVDRHERGHPGHLRRLGSPVYVSQDGAVLGYVGAGSIPSFSVGVRVSVTKSWAPYLLRMIGMNSWSASATATARGGYYAEPIPGALFPAGIAEAFFNNRQPCAVDRHVRHG